MTEQPVVNEFIPFYKILLGDSIGKRMNVKRRVLEHRNKGTQDQKEYLSRPYQDEEVKQVVFSIPRKKAPGPDGYISYFLQDN